jgi:hypothetical protein
MQDCKKYIEEIYNHHAFISLLSKIKPKELQDDLKQEVALVLLTKDCGQIKRLYDANELLQYSLKIIWNLGTSKQTRFYRMFKKNDYENLSVYLETLKGTELVTDSQIRNINKILDGKLDKNANEAHESIIFRKYVELNSGEKVAEFFGIPSIHCYEVIRKTKKELIKAIRNDS